MNKLKANIKSLDEPIITAALFALSAYFPVFGYLIAFFILLLVCFSFMETTQVNTQLCFSKFRRY
jgi:hypothetical protein